MSVPFARTQSIVRRSTFGLLAAVMTLVFLGLPSGAEASHYRFARMDWTKTGAQSISLTTTIGVRCTAYFPSGCPAPGATFSDLGPNSGQATGSGLFVVTASNPAEDWMLARVVNPFTYTNGGPFTASWANCCTITLNGAGGDSKTSSLVNLATNGSPVVSVPPMVNVGNTGMQTWSIPASSPGGETLKWRLATFAETGGNNPAGMSINQNTGAVSWNTSGQSAVTPYFASAAVESVNSSGTVVGRTIVSYIVRITTATSNVAPVWTAATPADQRVYDVNPGQQVAIDVGATDANNNNTVTINNLGLPTGATFTRVNGNPGTGAFRWTPARAAGGQEYLVTLTAQDEHGAGPAARTYKIRVASQNTAPTAPGEPSGALLSNSGSFPVSWTAATDADGDAIRYTLEGAPTNGAGTWQVLADNLSTTSTNVSALAEGTWRFRVTSRDSFNALGGPTTTSAAKASVVDKTRPATPSLTIASGQTGYPVAGVTWYRDSVSLQLADAGDPNLADSTPGSGMAPYTAANTVTTHGQSTASRTVSDRAGNVSTAGTRAVAVDGTTPSLSVTHGGANAAGWNTQPSVNLVISTSDTGSGIAGAAACTDNSTAMSGTAVSGEGVHNISCTVADAVGHTQTATDTVRIDSRGPVLTLPTSVSATASGSRSAIVTYTASALDANTGAEQVLCTPASGSSFPLQATTVNCTSTDDHGNQTAGSFGVNVSDASAPTIDPNVSGTFVGGWATSDVDVSWVVNDLESDISSRAGCDPTKVVVDTDGVAFTCSATSAGGSDSETVNVKRDTTKPVVSLTHAPNGSGGWDRSLPVSLTASANDGAIGSGVPAPAVCRDTASGDPIPSSGWSPADGSYQIACEATDLVGWKGTSATELVKVDTTKPGLTVSHVVDGSGGWNVTDDVQLVPVATDGGSGVAGSAVCKEDGSDLPGNVVSGEGVHEVTCTVSDLAGNTNWATDTVKIDTVKPVVSATHDVDGDNGWNVAQGVEVTATATDEDGSGVADGSEACVYADDASSVNGDGEHDVTCSAADEAGNVGTTTDHVKIDTGLPMTQATAPSTPQNGPSTVSLSATDSTSGVAATFVKVGDGAYQDADSVSIPAPADHSNDGTHTVSFYSVDSAGNEEAVQQAVVVVDTQTPTSSDDAPAGWSKDPVTVELTALDPGPAAVDAIYASVDGGDYAPLDEVVIDAPSDHSNDGAHTISYYAVDHAGNKEDAHSTTVRIDTTAPVSSDDADDDAWQNQDVTVGLSATDENGSGVDRILARLDGGTLAETSSVEVSKTAGDGEHTVSYFAVDEAGNEEELQTATVRIDTTAPVTTDDAPAGWQDGDRTVKLSATDEHSGVDVTRYGVGDGDVTDGTSIEVNTSGVHQIAYRSVDKAGNVEDSRSATLKIDKAKPTIEGSQTPVANAHGWINQAGKVTFQCADAHSGVAGCSPEEHLVDDETTVDGESVTGTATDNVGHTQQATVGPVRFDKTKPTLEGTADRPANDSGWYGAPVTISWTPADGLSGIDPATAPADSPMTGEGADQQAGPVSVSDKAGNQVTASGPKVSIDLTKPTIQAGTSPVAPNAAGWFDKAVTVSFDCADAVSGIQECPAAKLLDHDGTAQAASGTATDRAGHTASAGVTGIQIDTGAPVTVATLDCSKVNDYCPANTVTVDLAASDPAPQDGVTTSGVKSITYRTKAGGTTSEWTTVDSDATEFELSLPGSGVATVEYRATDVAGNVEPIGASSINHDSIAPVVTHTVDPTPNSSGWNRANATVTFAATDEFSGVALNSLTQPRLVDDETAGDLVNGEAVDNAGNVGKDSVTVRLDKTDPTISVAPVAGTAGANGWWTSAPTVRFTCADAGTVKSGVGTCTGDQVLGHGESVTGTAVDVAENKATASYGPVKVDGDEPAIEVNGIANGAIYSLAAVPTGSCAAEDVGPAGLDGACRLAVTGGLANGVGTYSYTATAKDMAGNVKTVTGSYRVRYAVKSGVAFWKQPINDTSHTAGATTSVFKAGSTIPAKFTLTDATGRIVQANTPPKWLVPVKGGAMSLPIDEATYAAEATAGDVFKWADLQYHFNWSTPKTGAGSYWRMGVALDDGTTQTVYVGLR